MEIDGATREALLKDPRVQECIRQHGEAALKDPEVQAQIVTVCKEKFPQYATMAASQVTVWASDPAVQEQAKAYAGVVLSYVVDAGDSFMGQIEQGPAGVRYLAFIASLVSMGLAILCLTDIGSALGNFVLYMISVYQLLFSATACLFEVSPETLEWLQQKTKVPISSYQDKMITYAGFLTHNSGRGMFYMYQGSLWLAFSSFTNLRGLLQIGIGVFLCFLGILALLMAKGIMPQTVAAKMRHSYRKASETIAGRANS
eukprot:TRINITY_DN1859_c0_g1_i2.p1 TRINITY_DN1859_c0_g1~~TRINITY_DN1859_c0_g1_i2.p1  ORF type:complete len:258 (+),score=41.06 TRINITY_DN1859_c0_g1_i2:114-887(+)